LHTLSFVIDFWHPTLSIHISYVSANVYIFITSFSKQNEKFQNGRCFAKTWHQFEGSTWSIFLLFSTDLFRVHPVTVTLIKSRTGAGVLAENCTTLYMKTFFSLLSQPHFDPKISIAISLAIQQSIPSSSHNFGCFDQSNNTLTHCDLKVPIYKYISIVLTKKKEKKYNTKKIVWKPLR
jgi:hypothetical protein